MADESYTEQIFAAKFQDDMSGPAEKSTARVRAAYDNLSNSIQQSVEDINKQQITLGTVAPAMLGGGALGAGAGYLAGGPIGAGIGAGIGVMVGLLTKLVSLRDGDAGKTEAEKREDTERGPLSKVASEIKKLNNIIKGFIIGTIMAPALEEVSIMVRTFMTPVGMFFRSIGQSLWPIVRELYPMWQDMWRDLAMSVTGFIDKHASKIIAFFQVWLPKSFSLLKAAWDSILMPFFRGVAAELKEWVDVWDIYGWEGIKRLAHTRWGELLDWWSNTAWPMLQVVAVAAWNGFVQWMDATFPDFTRRVRETWSAIVDLWDTYMVPFIDAVKSEFEYISNLIWLFGSATEGLSYYLEEEWRIFMNWWGKVAWPALTEFAQEAWNGLIGWLDENHPSFMKKAREVKEWFISLIAFLKDIDWEAVKESFSSIVTTLKSVAWTTVAANIAQIVGAIALIGGGLAGIGKGLAWITGGLVSLKVLMAGFVGGIAALMTGFFTSMAGVVTGVLGTGVLGAVVAVLLAGGFGVAIGNMLEKKFKLGSKAGSAAAKLWGPGRRKPTAEGLTSEARAILEENPDYLHNRTTTSKKLPPGVADTIAKEEGVVASVSTSDVSRNGTLDDILYAIKLGFEETVDAISATDTDTAINDVLRLA